MARDDHVLRIGCEGRKERLAQSSDRDPGAARELEILGDAAVEAKAFGFVIFVEEAQRVAEAVIPLLVEGFARDRLVAPIARRDVRAAHAPLELVADRGELY